MNDPVYVEAAKREPWRDRIIAWRFPKNPRRIAIKQGWRLCVSRPPTEREASFLLDLYRQELDRAQAKTGRARAAGAKSAEEEAWFYVREQSC